MVLLLFPFRMGLLEVEQDCGNLCPQREVCSEGNVVVGYRQMFGEHAVKGCGDRILW